MKNNKDNVMPPKGKKIIVGGTLREKLKAKIKELIRKQMKEISTTSAAGGGGGDGSAGPIKTPYAFGKVKNPTTGLDGYKQVGKNETGTINEKEGGKKSEKEPVKKKETEPVKKKETEPTEYTAIVKPKKATPVDPDQFAKVKAHLKSVEDELTRLAEPKKPKRSEEESD